MFKIIPPFSSGFVLKFVSRFNFHIAVDLMSLTAPHIYNGIHISFYFFHARLSNVTLDNLNQFNYLLVICSYCL